MRYLMNKISKETLAVTWQEKRKSLARLQKDRKFSDAGHLKRQFRVEVEELKRRTRCHKCGQVGHWSRECRNAGKGKSKGSGKSKAASSDSAAAYVEHFFCHGYTSVDIASTGSCTLFISPVGRSS